MVEEVNSGYREPGGPLKSLEYAPVADPQKTPRIRRGYKVAGKKSVCFMETTSCMDAAELTTT
jgi:hypothetical protein